MQIQAQITYSKCVRIFSRFMVRIDCNKSFVVRKTGGAEEGRAGRRGRGDGESRFLFFERCAQRSGLYMMARGKSLVADSK